MPQQPEFKPMRRRDVLRVGLGGAAASVGMFQHGALAQPVGKRTVNSDKFELDAKRAFGYLVEICELGNRASGTPAMAKQQELLVKHFQKHKGQVKYQTFDAADPKNGAPVRMANLLVHWHPEAKERILISCHYDSRPFPDRDPNPLVARSGKFIGANDGGSGVALLMELAHVMPSLSPTYGVDFVFFDGEELVYGDGPRDGEYFLGSTYFAKQYRDNPPAHRYVCGVLLDMIGDKTLTIFQEVNSWNMARAVTESVWAAAERVGVKEFIPRRKHEIRDDHLPLNEIAKIPTCDIIDFDYPHWHTSKDLPSACSGTSLQKVGKVLVSWMQNVPALGKPARGS